MKKKRIIIIFAVLLVFIIAYPVIYRWVQTGNPFSKETIMLGIVALLCALSICSFTIILFRSNNGKSPAQLKKRIIPLFIIFALGALLISFTVLSLVTYTAYFLGWYAAEDFISHLFRAEFPGAFRQFSIWILINFVVLFYVLLRQAINREQRLHEENLKYQYRTLKTQVNPHFLFNSLNTLSEIVYMDAGKADIYIQKLSGIYRYILDNEETDLINLENEISFVRQYFDLQKVRDDNKIHLEIDIENADKFKIVPISLQILIENALKHNLASEEKPLMINIKSDGMYVSVSNNIQRKSIVKDSSGLGLPNLKERVRLISGKEVIINQENNMFIVKLPIVSINK
jgi:Putative regulator of cell autolysis